MRSALGIIAISAISACSLRDAACGSKPRPQAQQAAAQATATASGERRATKILFLGDSITAGYGIQSDQAYPAVIQAKFAADGYPEVETVNAGISGDTTAGALRRFDQLVEPDVRIAVIALGGNDALRGLTVAQTHDNLAAIINKALDRRLEVLLVGMEAPTNYGQDYQDSFRALFVNLLREYRGRINFVPFLLEGVAANPALNQADGIHPNEEGAKLIADHLYPPLKNMVDLIQ